MGSAETIVPALDDLGADYLVIDPLEGYIEADTAIGLFDEILRIYGGPGYVTAPSLVFTSSDGLHRVYALPDRVGAAR